MSRAQSGRLASSLGTEDEPRGTRRDESCAVWPSRGVRDDEQPRRRSCLTGADLAARTSTPASKRMQKADARTPCLTEAAFAARTSVSRYRTRWMRVSGVATGAASSDSRGRRRTERHASQRVVRSVAVSRLHSRSKSNREARVAMRRAKCGRLASSLEIEVEPRGTRRNASCAVWPSRGVRDDEQPRRRSCLTGADLAARTSTPASKRMQKADARTPCLTEAAFAARTSVSRYRTRWMRVSGVATGAASSDSRGRRRTERHASHRVVRSVAVSRLHSRSKSNREARVAMPRAQPGGLASSLGTEDEPRGTRRNASCAVRARRGVRGDEPTRRRSCLTGGDLAARTSMSRSKRMQKADARTPCLTDAAFAARTAASGTMREMDARERGRDGSGVFRLSRSKTNREARVAMHRAQRGRLAASLETEDEP